MFTLKQEKGCQLEPSRHHFTHTISCLYLGLFFFKDFSSLNFVVINLELHCAIVISMKMSQ